MYTDGTSAMQMLENAFEVLEGGGEVPAGGISELIADNGETFAEVTNHNLNAANGNASQVSEVVAVAPGAAAGTATGAGILSMEVGAAGVAIAPALGILAGVGLYNLNPEFWTGVAAALFSAGKTKNGKVLGFVDKNGVTSFDEEVIEIYKNAFLESGIFDDAHNINIDSLPWELASPVTADDYNINDPFPIQGDVNPRCFPVSVGDLDPQSGYIGNVVYTAFHTSGDLSALNKYRVTLVKKTNSDIPIIVFASDTDFYEIIYCKGVFYTDVQPAGGSSPFTRQRTVTYNNKQVYYAIYDGQSSWELNPQYYYNFSDENVETGDFAMLNKIAWSIIYGEPEDNPYIQEDAILPNDDPFPLRYPEWFPVEFPEPLPSSMPAAYPLALPTPDITQNPSQAGANETDPQLDQLLKLLYDIAPNIIPSVTPDVDPYSPPVPEPVPQPEPAPNPADPNPSPTPSGITITLPTLDTTRASRMFTVYNPTDAELGSLGGFLWNSSIIEQIKKMWQNPLDGIISFHKVYCSPTVGSSKHIVLGYLDSEVSALEVTSQFADVDCGTVHIPERLHNATDYSPFTALHCYLPFIGIVELDTDECMNADLHIKYRIDVYTGTCVALLYLQRTVDMPNEQIVYTFSGNASQKLPLTAADFSGAVGALLGLAGAGVAVASGGSLGVAAGALGAAHSLTSEMVHIQHSGGLSANAGILSPRKPYIILSRQYGYDANAYNSFYGYPANVTVYIGNCTGFIKCKEVMFMGSCTEQEMNEIAALLKEGVYV